MPSRSNLNVKPALIDHLSAFDSLPNSALIDAREISALAMRTPGVGSRLGRFWKRVLRLSPLHIIKVGQNDGQRST